MSRRPRPYRPSGRRAALEAQLREGLWDEAEGPTRERRVMPGAAAPSLWALPQVPWIRQQERLGTWGGIEVFRGRSEDVGLEGGPLYYCVRAPRVRADDGGWEERPEFPDPGEWLGGLLRVDELVGGTASGCVRVVRGREAQVAVVARVADGREGVVAGEGRVGEPVVPR